MEPRQIVSKPALWFTCLTKVGQEWSVINIKPLGKSAVAMARCSCSKSWYIFRYISQHGIEAGSPNSTPVSRVVADKAAQTLYAYDDNNNLIASYPTTVGSESTPSPTGTHQVKVKIHEPNYTHTGDNGKKTILPPGPNNPVGLVWIGLSKPSYGIHGSPDPERISRQASAGCIRLTNWDALSLLGVINNDATVEFN